MFLCIQQPPEDDQCSLDSVSGCSLESEDEPPEPEPIIGGQVQHESEVDDTKRYEIILKTLSLFFYRSDNFLYLHKYFFSFLFIVFSPDMGDRGLFLSFFFFINRFILLPFAFSFSTSSKHVYLFRNTYSST